MHTRRHGQLSEEMLNQASQPQHPMPVQPGASTSGAIIRIAPIGFPATSDLTRGTLRRAAALEKTYAEIALLKNRDKATRLQSPAYWSHWIRDLCHPLSEQWVSSNPMSGRVGRLDSEHEAFLVHACDLRDAMFSTDYDFLKQKLVDSAMYFSSGEINGYRTSAVTINSNAGTARMFMDAGRVAEAICDMQRDARDSTLPRSLLAILLQARLLGIHPFADCNGRIARLLFNAVRSIGMLPYFPIGTAISASRGGFELRLRELERSGNAIPLLDYFLTCAEAELDVYR